MTLAVLEKLSGVALTELEVIDRGEIIAFTYADALKYHGMLAPGGVAQGFKVMERAFPLLETGPLERNKIRIESAFPGPGARDAFELVTRAFTDNRLLVDTDLPGPEALPAGKGRYFFRLFYGDRKVELRVRPGMVRDEYIELSRKGAANEVEYNRLEWLKADMAIRLMSLPAAEVYDVI